jgi:uncharacterized small protein (DUF1192 family)
MPENDTDYYQQPTRSGGLLHDLALMNWARSGVVNDLNNVQRQNKEIVEDNQELQSEVEQQQKKAKRAQQEADDLDLEVTHLSQTVKILRDEVQRLNELFNQPLSEIAKQHPGFAKLYEEQMLKLGEWMVSEKAFKEVAIELGHNQGLSSEQILKKVSMKEADVLNNRNNPAHNTNIKGSKVITPERAEKLKETMLGQIPNKEQAMANIQNRQSQFAKPSATNKLSR